MDFTRTEFSRVEIARSLSSSNYTSSRAVKCVAISREYGYAEEYNRYLPGMVWDQAAAESASG